MMSTVLSCFLLVVFAGVLNALKVHDIVRIDGIASKPELNGCFGVVKSVGKRVGVYAFLPHLVEAGSMPSEWYETVSLRPECLTTLTEADWKEAAVDSESLNDAYRVDTLSRLIMTKCSPESWPTDAALAGVWLNQKYRINILDSMPDLRPFAPQIPVQLKDSRVGLVLELSASRAKVLLFNYTREDFMNAVMPKKAPFVVKEVMKSSIAIENFETFVGSCDSLPDAAEGDSEACVQLQLRNLHRLIVSLCGGDPRVLRRDDQLAARFELILLWLNMTYKVERILALFTMLGAKFLPFLYEAWGIDSASLLHFNR